MVRKYIIDDKHNDKVVDTNDIPHEDCENERHLKKDLIYENENEDQQKQELPNEENNGKYSNENKVKGNKKQSYMQDNNDELKDRKIGDKEELNIDEQKTIDITDKKAYLAEGFAFLSKNGQSKLKSSINGDVQKYGDAIGSGLYIDTYNVEIDSDLGRLRSANHVFHEGNAFKQKFFFSCFWHQRYFILTHSGAVRYYNDKNQPGKGLFHIGRVYNFYCLDELRKKHPYRIIVRLLGREDIMAFDDESERNIWAAKLSKIRKRI